MPGAHHARHRNTAHIPVPVREEVGRRLTKIEGQVRGLQRMVEEGRHCVDVLTQLAATREALRQVSHIILRNYLENCVTRAMQDGDPQVYDELMSVFHRFDKE